MHLLPASLATPLGGEVRARHTRNGAAFFPVADNVRAAECGQAPRPRPDGIYLGRGEDGVTLPFPAASWWEPTRAD